MQPEPTPRPWFREPWLWIIVAPPLAAVVGGLTTLMLAISQPDVDVRDDFVRDGLAIYRNDTGDELAARLGLDASLEYDASSGVVGIELRGAAPQPSELRLRILHPTEPGEDLELTMLRDSAGVFTAAMRPLKTSGWTLELSAPLQGWRLRGRMEPGTSRARLAPERLRDRN